MHESPRAGAVVANPGGLRWFVPMASALARAGSLRLYATPIADVPRLRRTLAVLPSRVAGSATRQLALRPVPDGLEEGQVAMTATLSHLGLVAAGRITSSSWVVEVATEVARRRFDHATARLPSRGDLAVIASTGNALSTLSEARRLGIPSFLDYPLAHHSLTARLCAEEVRLTPQFAATLQFWNLPGHVKRRLEREIELADRVLVNSTFAQRSFLEAGIAAEKLVVTPFGVDLEMFSPSPPGPPGAGGDGGREQRPFRVLFAGQITQRKGISYLLEAFEQAGLPGSELVFLGRPVGPARSLLKRPGVRFWPAVPIGELASRVRACDVFVLPSLIEGFPQTAAIAMACGLPVILSENTSGHDVVDDGVNGYVIPIRDGPAIAERLRHLYANVELREAMGRAARDRVLGLTWDAYGHRIVDLVRGGTPDGSRPEGV